MLWLDLLIGERKAHLMLPEKKGLDDICRVVLVLRTDRISTSCLLNDCTGAEKWIRPRRVRGGEVQSEVKLTWRRGGWAGESRDPRPFLGPETLSQCGLLFSFLFKEKGGQDYFQSPSKSNTDSYRLGRGMGAPRAWRSAQLDAKWCFTLNIKMAKMVKRRKDPVSLLSETSEDFRSDFIKGFFFSLSLSQKKDYTVFYT